MDLDSTSVITYNNSLWVRTLQRHSLILMSFFALAEGGVTLYHCCIYHLHKLGHHAFSSSILTYKDGQDNRDMIKDKVPWAILLYHSVMDVRGAGNYL
jgi:hypothetical protein